MVSRGQVRSRFAVVFDRGALASVRLVAGGLETEYVAPGARLGDVRLVYRALGAAQWRTLETGDAEASREVAGGTGELAHEARYPGQAGAAAPEVRVAFTVGEEALGWRVTVRNRSDAPLEIGDLAFPLPIATKAPGTPILKHGLICGHSSHVFWMRGDSMPPFLTLTPDRDTQLEYWEAAGGYRVYAHSLAAAAVAAERGCTWRQPSTGLVLDPGEERSYGFAFHGAASYDDIRRIKVERGLIDVHVVPGMTVPADLSARFALRTREPVHSVVAELPGQTEIRRVEGGAAVAAGARGGVATHLYEVRFSRLGENRLEIGFGAGRHTYLEFFATEPLETMIRKRGAFIAAHQWRDPSLWYDGLLAEWAMDTRVQLGPDNYDRIRGWRIYEVTCDDPGLSKPAFLAAKNAELPEQAEVDALDYYLERFVWGGLQRTTEETFAYGIYGIPDWKQNRESDDPGRNGRQHLWRIYDYPHLILTYFAMYRIARHQRQIRTALTAREYLQRAYGTAIAMFTIPWEIEQWSAYATGLYNELVIEDLIGVLADEGMVDEAQRLRPHWERKVRTFVNDHPDLFRSEYAFDSTGFESTHALAKYALRVATPADPDAVENEVRPGWGKYPAATAIHLEPARQLMARQLAANLFCRGWLETAYYLYGSDYRSSGGSTYTLTYMSQMGGWAVLDYGLHHAADPPPYLRLGYGALLSAWALLNSGTPESSHGYWYPGAENDGAAGGGFEPAPFGETWLEQPHSRGSWYYSCEIDLGFCGALRGARTVLADDPLFGRFCFGGTWQASGEWIEVVPKDGVRRRFHALLGGGRLYLQSEVDRFAVGEPIRLRDDLAEISFRLEHDGGPARTAQLRLTSVPGGTYAVRRDGTEVVGTVQVTAGEATVVDVALGAGRRSVPISITRADG